MISRKINSEGLADILEGETGQKEELVLPPIFWLWYWTDGGIRYQQL